MKCIKHSPSSQQCDQTKRSSNIASLVLVLDVVSPPWITSQTGKKIAEVLCMPSSTSPCQVRTILTWKSVMRQRVYQIKCKEKKTKKDSGNMAVNPSILLDLSVTGHDSISFCLLLPWMKNWGENTEITRLLIGKRFTHSQTLMPVSCQLVHDARRIRTVWLWVSLTIWILLWMNW